MRATALAVALALLAAGCASPKVAPPPDDLRAELRVLGLPAPGESSANPPKSPVKGTGEAALSGGAQGGAGTFAGMAQGFCQTGDPFACAVGLALGVVLAPVGAVVGAGVGASKSHSGEEVDSAQSAIVAVVRRTRPEAALAERFSALAAERHGIRIVPVICGAEARSCHAESDPPPKYILRLEYAGFAFRAIGRIEPDLAVTATVRARVFHLAGGQTVYEREWGYESKDRPYFDLAADGGAAFEEMIAESHDAVARAVLHDLFETRTPSPIGRRSAGTVWTVSGPMVEDPPDAAVVGGAEPDAHKEGGDPDGADWAPASDDCGPFAPCGSSAGDEGEADN